MRNLGEAYSLENICKRILAQRLPQREETPKPRRCRLLGDLKQARKVTGFRVLYFHYCYLLGVFPQKQDRQRGLFLSCGKTFSGMERGAARLAEKAGGEESSVKSELRGLKAAPDASHRQAVSKEQAR